MTSRKTYNINTMKGFSLIEIIIVIALVAVVASMSSLFSINSISRSYTISERDLLVSLLTQTRARALANVNKSAHGLYIDTNNYVFYEGNAYNAGNTTNKTVPKLSTEIGRAHV